MSPAEAFRLYVYNEKVDRLELVVSHDTGTHPATGHDALIERACRAGRTRFFDKDGNEMSHPDAPVELAIPLVASNKPVGAMWIGRPRTEGHYEDETITILLTMAQHAAAAIENVKLYSELSEKERYEREMVLARQQQVLAHGAACSSAKETVDEILAEVDRFVGGHTPHDDITPVAIRKTG